MPPASSVLGQPTVGCGCPSYGLDQMHTKGQGEDGGEQLAPTRLQQAHKISAGRLLHNTCPHAHPILTEGAACTGASHNISQRS